MRRLLLELLTSVVTVLLVEALCEDVSLLLVTVAAPDLVTAGLGPAHQHRANKHEDQRLGVHCFAFFYSSGREADGSMQNCGREGRIL